MRFFQAPNHMASVFSVLICNPLTCLNSSKSFSSLKIESQSLTSTVVSSAYCVILTSFWSTLMPLISVSFLTALANSSIQITKRRPDKGHPCLTPRSRGKKSDACPLCRTQLDTWW